MNEQQIRMLKPGNLIRYNAGSYFYDDNGYSVNTEGLHKILFIKIRDEGSPFDVLFYMLDSYANKYIVELDSMKSNVEKVIEDTDMAQVLYG